jgi:hypothetical protein
MQCGAGVSAQGARLLSGSVSIDMAGYDGISKCKHECRAVGNGNPFRPHGAADRPTNAIKPITITRFSVFDENVKKLLFPVQSEDRTDIGIRAEQFSVGAAIRTACKSTPARDS